MAASRVSSREKPRRGPARRSGRVRLEVRHRSTASTGRGASLLPRSPTPTRADRRLADQLGKPLPPHPESLAQEPQPGAGPWTAFPLRSTLRPRTTVTSRPRIRVLACPVGTRRYPSASPRSFTVQAVGCDLEPR